MNLLYILLAIIVLMVLITVHEFGHFIAGKILGFKINEFSIGFGPALFKKTNKKTGERFSIRCIPLGGFCAFEGEDEKFENDKENNENKKTDEKVNISSVDDTTTDLENTCESNSDKTCGEALEVKDNEIISKVEDDAKASENTDEVKTLDLKESVNDSKNKKYSTKIEQLPKVKGFNDEKPWKRLIVLFSGVFFNFLFGLFTAVLYLCIAGYAVPQVTMLSPLNNNGFMTGDKIVAVNGKTIEAYRSFGQLVKGYSAGQEFTVTVEREGQNKDLKVSYADNGAFRFIANPSLVQGKIFKDEVVNGKRVSYTFEEFQKEVYDATAVLDNKYYKSADINITEKYTEAELISSISLTKSEGNTLGMVYLHVAESYTFWETLYKAWPFCFYICGLILSALGGIFTGATKLADLGGTVTAVSQIVEVSKMGINQFLLLLPLLSMNLAIFNILPIPALDGARMVFVAIEGIFRKPINRKVEGYIHSIGLIVLFALVIFLDIYHFAVL
ncbi:MAG: site-2 protease family protein [Clostridia bacterium]